ncbi:hypothetical protein I6E17_02310 [Fusobacterium perfoetens]|uniref:hypothetical protein n=1 Tax=Fusobacterium perfoetens TaxID=852 RepID=UPI001F2F80F2|nr:hypothetical protein [Fusobacterium perfoetens]MCF2625008.1 hypothetical protein [Fusobacterium perfoetens]
MKRKRINYDEIINRLDEYLKKKNDKYMLIVIYPNGTGYKVQESDGFTPKDLYFNNENELKEYLKDKEDNKNCVVINCNIIK